MLRLFRDGTDMPLPFRECYQKPPIIRAVCFDGDSEGFAAELGDTAYVDHHKELMIITPLGPLPVRPGDYIVIGTDGLVYPVPKGVFEARSVWYEPGAPTEVM